MQNRKYGQFYFDLQSTIPNGTPIIKYNDIIPKIIWNAAYYGNHDTLNYYFNNCGSYGSGCSISDAQTARSSVNAVSVLFMGSECGTSALAVAAYNGHLECVKILSNVPTITFGQSTPLLYAAKAGHSDILKYFLNLDGESGCPERITELARNKINQLSLKSHWPLQCAVASGNYESVELLLKANADISIEEDYYGLTLTVFHFVRCPRMQAILIAHSLLANDSWPKRLPSIYPKTSQIMSDIFIQKISDIKKSLVDVGVVKKGHEHHQSIIIAKLRRAAELFIASMTSLDKLPPLKNQKFYDSDISDLVWWMRWVMPNGNDCSFWSKPDFSGMDFAKSILRACDPNHGYLKCLSAKSNQSNLGLVVNRRENVHEVASPVIELFSRR